MNLGQAIRYFDLMRTGRIHTAAKVQIAISLTRNLWEWVYTDNLAQIYNVPDKNTMRTLIKSKVRFPPLGNYTQSYFERMLREGKKPHGSLRDHTIIEFDGNKVKFHIPKSATTRTRTTQAGKVSEFNFGPQHERNKSILKSTIVIAWQDIMKRIGNVFKTYAEMV